MADHRLRLQAADRSVPRALAARLAVRLRVCPAGVPASIHGGSMHSRDLLANRGKSLIAGERQRSGSRSVCG
jgi:hypothetical protein